jgi:spore coat protein A, manganese oxidase
MNPGTTPPEPSPRLPRRDLLRLGLAGGGALAATPLMGRLARGPEGVNLQASSGGTISGDAPTDPPRIPHFTQPFRRNPELEPYKKDGQGRNVYRLTQAAGDFQILPPSFPATPLFMFNGTFPGPTIRQKRGGTPTVVENRNRLPKGHPYSTHLHGSPSQPFYDGHPDDLTPVNGDKTYYYPNNQSSRTLWYHDHAIHQTADHVYRGLAGFFLQEPADAEVKEFGLDRLPSGDYDVPILVSDIQFNPQGKVYFDDHGEDSLWGNVVLVNGVPWPRMEVDPTMYRFRILVGSVSRGFDFRLSNGMPMTMIGTDAGLMAAPVKVTSFRHGMAERYEVVIDFSGLAGKTVTLLNTGGDDQMRDVMQFVVGTNTNAPKFSVPDKLAKLALPPRNPVTTRNFRFERSGGLWVINGLPWEERVAASPRVNTTEKWVFENKSGGWFHPIHVHLVDFEILSRNGGKPFPYEAGLKDVVYVGPNERVEVLMRFIPAEKVGPDPNVLGKYVMHCHNTVHEDHDMMTEFDLKGGAAAAGAAQAAAHRSKMQPSMMVQWELQA